MNPTSVGITIFTFTFGDRVLARYGSETAEIHRGLRRAIDSRLDTIVCALFVASAVFIVLEMDGPFDGLIRVSAEPLRRARDQLNR